MKGTLWTYQIFDQSIVFENTSTGIKSLPWVPACFSNMLQLFNEFSIIMPTKGSWSLLNASHVSRAYVDDIQVDNVRGKKKWQHGCLQHHYSYEHNLDNVLV